MNKNLFNISIALVALVLFLAQCSTTSKFYTPSDVNVSSTATLDELNQGRALLMEKCGQCHGIPAPRKHDAEGWKPTMASMQVKAQISDAQRELIYKYLTSEKN
ncbi:MAG: hypothetical protein KA242_04150 [Chitinophagales bacterium]|jgi:mono/diheme cytochrome c family protein|nr:hypothetical protein [Chitinophagales bacterium]